MSDAVVAFLFAETFQKLLAPHRWVCLRRAGAEPKQEPARGRLTAPDKGRLGVPFRHGHLTRLLDLQPILRNRPSGVLDHPRPNPEVARQLGVRAVREERFGSPLK